MRPSESHRTPGRRPPGGTPLCLAIALLALVLAAPLVLWIPPGEAPDEPAHLAYVDHLLSRHALPPVRAGTGTLESEAYQPPLAYLAMALSARAAGARTTAYPYVSNPELLRAGNGGRAYLEPPDAPAISEARRAIRAARAINLVWGTIAAGATLLLCLRLASSPWIALAGAAPFCLAPQLLFTSATANNDALLTACAAVSLYSLATALPDGAEPRRSTVASAVAGTGLGVKASAVTLAPALALAALARAIRGRDRRVAALLLPAALIGLAFAALGVARTGSLLPQLPTGWGGATASHLSRLVTEPRWIPRAWAGFWAMFGWYNLHLPRPTYLAFLPSTLLAAGGLLLALGRRARGSRLPLLLATTFATNLALLLLYLVRVDWQPQGRYLLPSLPALAGLATYAIERARSRWAAGIPPRHLAITSLALAVAMALLALTVVRRAYGA